MPLFARLRDDHYPDDERSPRLDNYVVLSGGLEVGGFTGSAAARAKADVLGRHDRQRQRDFMRADTRATGTYAGR